MGRGSLLVQHIRRQYTSSVMMGLRRCVRTKASSGLLLQGTTTRLPVILQEEIRRDAANHCGDERINHTSEDANSSKYPAVLRQISRKELRMQQRKQRRQQHHERKLQWKEKRRHMHGPPISGLLAEANEGEAATGLSRRKRSIGSTQSNHFLESSKYVALNGADANFADAGKGVGPASSIQDGVPGNAHFCGGLVNTRENLVSIASEMTQNCSGDKRGDNCFLEELRLLEQKLGLGANPGYEMVQGTQRQRLRQELECDGFDAGFQDILDEILSSCYSSKASKRHKTSVDPKVLESAVSRKDNSIRLPRYDDEIRLLECRLGVIDGDGDEVSHSRKKLRKELEDDGFDADLQDFLDGVLVGSSKNDKLKEHSQLQKGVETSGEGDYHVEQLSRSTAETGPPLPRHYVPPHKREQPPSNSLGLEEALRIIKIEVVRAFNRVCEGNANLVFQMLFEVLQRTSVQLRESLCPEQDKAKFESFHKKFVNKTVDLICTQVEQSCITSKFTTTSLIATQIALCCALGKVWYLELCSALVARIAVVFAQNFDYAISRSQDVRQSQQAEQDGQHDECCFNARHAVVAVCCLFDYGFLSCRLFVQVIRRVLGNENSQSICEFRIELLILLLRLGAGKLRQNSSSLFLSVWKEIHASLELQGERDACHKNHEQSSRAQALRLELEDVKAGKQKERQLLVKSSLTAMRQWLSNTAHFGPSLLESQYEIDGTWQELEKGGISTLCEAAAIAGRLQLERYRGDAKADAAAPDAARICKLAKTLDHSARILRFSTDLQRSIFSCLIKADGPDGALRLMQECGIISTKQQTMLQLVGVALQCCLQEKVFNSYYGLVLARLCGVCCCQRSIEFSSEKAGPNCGCFFLPEKPASRYRRVLQRGISAQASAALGFSLRRLLNLAKLTAFLVRINIVQLNVVRFLPFEDNRLYSGPMGLSGKLGLFLKEVCEGILCQPTFCAVPLPEITEWKKWSLKIFDSLKGMPDICEAFISLLKDVIIPETSHRRAKKEDCGMDNVDLDLTKAVILRLTEFQEPAES